MAASSRSCASRRSTRRAAARSRTRAGSSTRRPARARSCGRRTGSRTTRCCSSRAPGSLPVTACARSCRGRFATRRSRTTRPRTCCRALQIVVGEGAKQAGSAVRPDKLRFDFTHPRPLSPEEREEVERIVNEKVFEDLPVHAFVTPIDEARKLGATMLFGEKYGDEVRVVEIPASSRELCGGTHVRWTAEIGPFVLLSESSVGAGVRRIEALTAGAAWEHLRARAAEAQALKSELEQARKDAKVRRHRGRRCRRDARAEGGDRRDPGRGGRDRGARRRRAAGAVRPGEAASGARSCRARLAGGRARAPGGELRPLRGGPWPRRVGRRRGRRRPSWAAAAAVGRRWPARAARDPEKLGEALATAEQTLRERLGA